MKPLYSLFPIDGGKMLNLDDLLLIRTVYLSGSKYNENT